MTPQVKSARLQLIEQRSSMAAKSYATYWLTRNSLHGVLSDAVDIWTSLPIREMHGESILWTVPYSKDYYGRWSLEEAYKEVRFGIPEDDRMCVRVGPE